MENLRDKLRAFALALALHVVCVLSLLVGLWWTHETRPVTMPGPVIEATLIGPTSAPQRRPGALRPVPAKPVQKPEPPKPEPPKPEPQKPEPQPEPPKPQQETPTEVQRQDQIDQQRVAALAQQQAEQQQREQEEKVRQKQVLLEEEKKVREEQQKQLADIKKQREDAEKKLNRERDRLAQLEDRNQREAQAQAQPEAPQESEQAQTGANGQDDGLAARYSAAIQAQAVRNWMRPEGVSSVVCDIKIVQLPGGEVLSATATGTCSADDTTRRSMEAAIQREALPYRGYESVFRRQLILTFCYPKEACPK